MQHRFRKPCRKLLLPFFLGWILICLAAPVHAVGEEETVARNFLKFLRSDKSVLSSEVLQGSLLNPALPPVAIAHLFHLRGGGYLLISSDRSISPVKAYSLIGEFAALPEPYRKALLSELELRARVALEATGRMPLEARKTETGARWDFLLGLEAGRTPLAYTPGAFLLKTRWNQRYPYNKFLPQVGGQTVVAGCVNVAVAQVMRHHGYPASAKGVASYLWDGPPEQTLKTVLYRGFNWDNMPAMVDSTTPEYQVDEVALLIRDLGIANHTDFDFSGSSTSLNSQALMENFGYSTSLSDMFNSPNFEAFLETLKGEIDAERPVLLTFPGHMTVADGYSADSSGRKVHVNMGWGGVDDDFYFLDDPLDPWVHAGGYNFPTTAGALKIHYGIKPCSTAAGDCNLNLEAGDGINGLAIAGNFNQAGDKDLYEVYLQGVTTISANRGYSNIGFFVSLFSAADGSEVFTLDDDFQSGVPAAAGDLSAGKYLLRASLCNVARNSCYSPDGNGYTVTLTSGALTVEEKVQIDQNLEKAPVIGNTFPDLILKTNSEMRKIRIDARDENDDALTLSVQNSNPAAVGAVLNGNILELTLTGVAKVSSRIAVTATANGKATEKSFTEMTDNVETAFGKVFMVGDTFVNNTDDFKTHRVILDGSCSIHGDNGFTTQGFYSSVLDGGGNVIVPAVHPPTDISDHFGRTIYQLGAALYMVSGGSTRYFTSGIGAPYVLEVSCPDADASTPTIAGLLGIDLSGANLSFDHPGDINDDGFVSLADAVLVLQMLSGMDMTGKTIVLSADANGDQRIGLAEALFILQWAAGLRLP
jgi:hypothetical protein